MKNDRKMFIGFIILIVTTFFLLAMCDAKIEETTFPSSFIGTWERAYQSPFTSTITFTTRTMKASNQNFSWNLHSVSGDSYTIYPDTNPKLLGPIKINYKNGNLVIIDSEFDAGTTGWQNSENDWTGTWKRQ